MSPEQWSKAVELFHTARGRIGEERVALLDSVCSDDPALRLAVEQMLRDDEASCSLLDHLSVEKLALDGLSRHWPRRERSSATTKS
jgi:hypothetical protein